MKTFRIRKGHNLKVAGIPAHTLEDLKASGKIVIHPQDFKGIKPKLIIQEGAVVSVGTTLFINKLNPDVKFTSPASGTVSKIEYGDRRVIHKIEIVLDGNDTSINFNALGDNPTSNEIKNLLLESGLWPTIRQRPFSKIANQNNIPKAIFVSTFNTAPLACDQVYSLNGKEVFFQSGINALSKLTNGKVHVNIENSENSNFLRNIQNAQLNEFIGPHPSGNVGIQIHHLDPIKSKDDIVWYISCQDVASIGKLVTDGTLLTHKVIALGGPEVHNPRYINVRRGTKIHDIIGSDSKSKDSRIISGDILSGTKRNENMAFGFYDETISILKEGRDREFLGWAKPGLSKYTIGRSFLSALLPKRLTNFNTNMNGSHRAIISFGNWEKVLPMDILPEFLVKSILAKDIEEMEKLGIYECAEEDFALCAFSCQSKTDVSGIISNGLTLAEQEG